MIKPQWKDMDKMALELEQLGNAKLPVRVHIKEE